MKKFLLSLFSVVIVAFLAEATLNSVQHTREKTVTATGLKTKAASAPVKMKGRRAAAESPATVPFTLAMGKDSPDADFIKANFTVINANDDSRTWNVCTTNKYSSCMAAKSGESVTADDWLISMPITFKAGSYKLSFDLGFMGSTAKGSSISVFLGKDKTVAAMTQTIAPEVLYTAKDQTSYQYDFTVPEDGNYYIGFHCTTSVEDAGAALLYNFGVDANSSVSAPENTVEVPFTHQLGKNSADVDFIKNTYTTINANGDNRQWQVASVDYTACMAPNADNVDANDDWLITMPIHMKAGNYVLSASIGYMSGTGVIFDVKMGTDPTVEGLTTQIVPSTTITDKDQKTYEYNFNVPAEGYYYIGVHCTTTKELKSAMKLFSIGVREGEAVVIDPPAAGTLTWQLAPKGELKATVTYTAPTKTKSGADLQKISKVELTSRWTVDKFEFTNVTPGQVIVQEVPMYQGINNRFTGVAYVDDVAGDMVEYKSIFCGKDTPRAPQNVTLKTNDDFVTATLSWDPVGEVGENGGYVDPEEVVYYIFDAFGSYYDPALASTKGTSLKIDYSKSEGQDFYAYQVTAGYEDNYSLDTSSDIVIAGQPDELPFTESFANGRYDGLWALDPHTSYSYQQYGTVTDSYFENLLDPDDPDSPAPLKSFDGDNGFFYWLPYEKDVMVGLMSLRADVSKASNPVLEFRYQGQGNTIDVLLAGGTDDMKVVKTIDLKSAPTSGWETVRIPLTEYKAKGAVNFEIRLTANQNDDEHTWSIPIDAIAVRDLVETDMRIVTASASAVKVKPQDVFTVTARVQNQGTKAAAADAVLYVNGVKADEKSLGDMQPDAFDNVTLSYKVPLNAPETLAVKFSVEAEGDGVASNNDFEADVQVQYPVYPSVSNLEGSYKDGKVTLTWDAPVMEAHEPVTVLEDFENEDYEQMGISGAGGFTVYDGDGETTINVFNETYNPYQTKPMAFQLFNKELSNPYYDEDCTPHSGNSFMIAPTSYYADNDNWLISPELSGRKQTVSFWAKSFSITWPESMEVRYSTTGNNAPTDFSADPLLEVVAEEVGWYMEGGVPEEWTKYEVELPEGTKYFAIRHTGWYTCALFIDDVTYEGMPDIPADLTVEGYHVMHGDMVVTETPVTDTVFTHVLATEDTGKVNNYTVIPVYNYGVAKGQSVSVDVPSGVSVIESAEGEVKYYNLQGVEVMNPEPGTVVIKVADGKATKLIAR